MKGKLVGLFMVLLVILCFQSACLAADEFKDIPWVLRTATAEVVAINANAMEITLKGSFGNYVTTCAVDKKVKNLSTFAVGDKIRAEFYMSLASEVRKPTPEEKKTQFVKLDETSPLPPNATPGSVVKMFRNLVTVKIYDPLTGFLVVKNSKGNEFWINTVSQSFRTKVAAGDVVVVKYSPPYIIALKKL